MKRAFILIGVVICIISISTIVHAVDNKIYPPGICQPHNNFENWRILYSIFGRIYNRSVLNPVQVICPILRDDGDTIRGPHAVTVYYWNRHPYDQIACRLRSTNGWGSHIAMTDVKYSIPGGPRGFGSISWRNFPIPSRRYGNSMYSLHCYLPPAGNFNDVATWSFLGAIVVKEGDTDSEN